jgi:hypothetical protein
VGYGGGMDLSSVVLMNTDVVVGHYVACVPICEFKSWREQYTARFRVEVLNCVTSH